MIVMLRTSLRKLSKAPIIFILQEISIFNFLLLHRLKSNKTAFSRKIIYERTEDSKPLFLET